MIAINLEYVDLPKADEGTSDSSADAVLVKAGDEVAIIPPVSGGWPWRMFMDE